MTPIRLRVEELRKAKGMTQGQLAAAANIRQATLSEIESGKTTRVDFAVLEALASALGVNASILIDHQTAK